MADPSRYVLLYSQKYTQSAFYFHPSHLREADNQLEHQKTHLYRNMYSIK